MTTEDLIELLKDQSFSEIRDLDMKISADLALDKSAEKAQNQSVIDYGKSQNSNPGAIFKSNLEGPFGLQDLNHLAMQHAMGNHNPQSSASTTLNNLTPRYKSKRNTVSWIDDKSPGF